MRTRTRPVAVPSAPPTAEEFERRVGDPLLSFELDDREIGIPTGPPHCCRTVHQAHCDDHVAATLIGCEFDIRLPDGEIDARRPVRQTFDGDVLARPLEFSAAVQSVTVLAQVTAEAEGGVLLRLGFDVWTLNLELAAVWRYLQREREGQLQAILEGAEKYSTAWIEALPIELVTPDRARDLARILGSPEFRHVRAYARKVIVLPHEIGHDDDARYVTDLIGGVAGAVPPVVDAIRRDPQEDAVWP